MPHTGGKRFDADSEYYATLLRWLEAGAPHDAAPTPAVVGVDLYPPSAVLDGEGATQQFIARARYSDGTDRDVTTLAVFLTNNDNSAPDHAPTAWSPPPPAARRSSWPASTRTPSAPRSSCCRRTCSTRRRPITGNYIDELVDAKLKKLRILPSGVCTDEEFLRRVTLDITGLLPTADEYAAFMADADPDKRAKLVDRLLDRKEFAEIWAMKWAELLMIKSTNQVSYKSMFLYYNWLTDQIANNVPLDQMVQELLGGHRRHVQEPGDELLPDRARHAEDGRERRPGLHGHPHPVRPVPQPSVRPLDDGRLLQLRRVLLPDRPQGRRGLPRDRSSSTAAAAKCAHPVGGRAMPPKFLGGAAPDVAGKDRRAVLAKWLTSPENPYFATSVANRVWAHFFGNGIVEPVDDVRVSNPASNPELFTTLGDKLVEYKYDFKQLVRDICNSQTYQRSTERNESNDDRRAELRPRQRPPHPGRECCSTASAR